MASFRASLIRPSAAPDISKRIAPGFTCATHLSGAPFPDPIGTSAPFDVRILSGKILIQTFPPRFIFLVIARRAASICLAVISPASTVLTARSP